MSNFEFQLEVVAIARTIRCATPGHLESASNRSIDSTISRSA